MSLYSPSGESTESVLKKRGVSSSFATEHRLVTDGQRNAGTVAYSAPALRRADKNDLGLHRRFNDSCTERFCARLHAGYIGLG